VSDATMHLLPRTALAKVPRQARSIEMVHTILDAAKRVLEREGLVAFTTNRVATVAGISVGSLYQYFPNKEALVLGVVERGLMMTEDVVRSMMDAPVAGTFEEAFAGVMSALIRHLEPRRALLREILAATPLLAETGFLTVIEAQVREMLVELDARYDHPPRTRAASYVRVNALTFVFIKWMTEAPAHVTEAAFIEQATKLVGVVD
jgi:AcrR family transcriptional regulator